MALESGKNIDETEDASREQKQADQSEAEGKVPRSTGAQIAGLFKAVQTHDDASRRFLLRVVQPGLAGLMDGSVSTLAPIFVAAFATGKPSTAFLVGIASAMGAGISMAFSEALSDDGALTGRGSPVVRGLITGFMTFFGGCLHTLPFLISNINTALIAAYFVVGFELILISGIRHRYFGTSWLLSIVQVVGGGALVFAAAFIFGHA